MDFTALKNFHSDETGSDYVAGMSYTAREPTDHADLKVRAKRAKLRDLLPTWVKENKIIMGRVNEARATGKGAVK